MKKLSSMLALGLACALTLGMTVSAAESPTTEGTAPTMTQEVEKQYEEKAAAQATATTVTTTVGGKTVTLTKAAVQPETLLQAEQLATGKVTKAAASLGITVPEEAVVTTTVVGSVDISAPVGVDMSAGYQLTIENAGIQAGGKYVLLHLENGVWTPIKTDSVAAGKVTATFHSLSPVAIVLVKVDDAKEDSGDADDTDDTDDSSVPAAQAAVNPAVSPKTADAFPAAGAMALICLAGAAVCAGKIRYNK